MAPALTISDIIQGHIASLNDYEVDKPFFVANLQAVEDQVSRWRRKLPGVVPYYAVKCNSDIRLLTKLADLDVRFDCASIEEIEKVLSLGVPSHNIVFANPTKSTSAIDFAYRVGVNEMTFDSSDELEKIADIHPSARLLLRIHAEDDSAIIKLGDKFGASLGDVENLLSQASDLDLHVNGVCFHVGSGAKDPSAFTKAIRHARLVVDRGRELGHVMTKIDIGGGFQSKNFDIFAKVISNDLEREFFDLPIEIMAEPGRYFCASAFTMVTRVIGRRKGEATKSADMPPDGMLYQNDGVFGAFMNVLVEKTDMLPWLLKDRSNNGMRNSRSHCYRVWGPTCDSTDLISGSIEFPSEVLTGDFLVYEDMGAYTLATFTRFNGFGGPYKVVYVE